jgi:long-subunit fatty acid transport protein
MKKVLFAIAAMTACVSASAQLWVSGSVGIGNTANWNEDKAKTTWNFSPSIGYALDDALEVGLALGLDGSSKDDNSEFNFSIAPFARYTFLSEGDFSMFIQGNIEFAAYSEKNHNTGLTKKDIKGQGFGVRIMPGVKYTLTDNFAIVATFGSLYYEHQDFDPEYYNNVQNRFGCNIFSGLNFGLVYSF